MATWDQIIDTVIAEAIGEGDNGMAAVAWTMRNRAEERGVDIGDVVTGRAYTGLNHPGTAAQRAQRDPATRARVDNILQAVTTGAYPDPTGGATHYWAPRGMPGGEDPYWADEEATQFGQHRIGNQIFLPKRQPALIPPGEIPNVVGTMLDTKRGAAAKTYAMNDFGRLVNIGSGAFLPPSSPVTQSILAGRQAIDNTRPREYPNARTVMLPVIKPSTLRNSTDVPQSVIERGVPRIASASKAAPQSITERPAPRGLVDSLANTRNAGDAIALAPIMGGKQNPVFDAGYDFEQGVMQRFQSPVGEMPTLDGTRAAFHLPPMRPDQGQPPATRTVPSFAVTRPLAGPRDGIGAGAGSFNNLTALLGAGQSTPSSSGGRQPPVTAPYSTQLTASDRARLAQNAPRASAPRETRTEVSLGDVMSPRFPTEPGPSWNEFIGVMGRPAVASPAAPIKTAERLPSVSAMAFEPMAAAPVAPPPPPYKGPFVPPATTAPTYRTVMRDEQIENPAYTRWKQDALNEPGSIPIGDVYHGLSRDSMAQAAAGRNFAANMPARWITIQKPTQVRNNPVAPRQVAVPQSAVPRRPVSIVAPVSAPQRSSGIASLLGNIGNLGGMVQSGIGGIVGKVMADPGRLAMSMPVGAYLGPAANGGAMFRSYGGVSNSRTQESDWWNQVVNGARSRGDGGAQSLSGTQN